MISRLLDRMIGFFAPGVAAERMAARATLQQIEQLTNGQAGYNAGKFNRLTKHWARGHISENAVPRAQIEQLRSESWNLYRNNPHARKIVHTVQAKVIGRGPTPVSLATRATSGNEQPQPHVEFREAAQKLWWSVTSTFDVRGVPGRGGLDLVELQKQALRSVMLGGGCLYRLLPLSRKEQRRRSASIPLALQLMGEDRLSRDVKAEGFVDAHQFFNGIELDADGARVAYHLMPPVLDQLQTFNIQPVRRPASEIGHLFVAEDIDQLCGVPWFAPALLQFRDTGDLQYNVLKSSAMAACVIGGYKLPRGKSQLGLNATDSSDLVDADGNQITRLSPGMLLNLGQDGSLELFSPNQPSLPIEAFIQHLLRGIGGAVPGVKSSTVTGDYRRSSFSSERSADNDCWPELEGIQDWFAAGFLQPIYEAIITAGVIEGHFAGIITADEFAERRRELLDTHWQGPVARSINPVDDANAAALRIKSGQSSPQIECANVGRDWQDVLRQIAEFRRVGAELGLSPEFLDGVLSVEPTPTTEPKIESGDDADTETEDAEQTSAAA